MLSDVKKNLEHYTVLATIFVAAAILYGLVSYNPHLQLVVVSVSAVFYVVWGVFHHKILGDITVKIVLEYMLVAMMVDLIFAVALL